MWDVWEMSNAQGGMVVGIFLAPTSTTGFGLTSRIVTSALPFGSRYDWLLDNRWTPCIKPLLKGFGHNLFAYIWRLNLIV